MRRRTGEGTECRHAAHPVGKFSNLTISFVREINMSEDWDFYFCKVDDRPASIFVDLGVAREAPLSSLPVVGYVRVHMHAPREDGLSSQVEFEALTSVEHALETLQSDGAVVYVGRNTSDGFRDLYFYLRTAEGWDEYVAGIMKAFPNYQFESGTRIDPKWTTYFNFLYPSDEDRERIQNRRTCEVLEKRGDSLEQPRPINHWAYFPTPESRRAFVTEASTLGYQLEELIDPEGRDESFGARLSCIGRPSPGEIDDLTLPLFRAARSYGGDYDGWETQVVSPVPDQNGPAV